MSTKQKKTSALHWMHWRKCRSHFLEAAPGTLANYYASTYEPNRRWAPNYTKRIRVVVKRFIDRHGMSTKLAKVDNALLEKFKQAEIDRRVSGSVAQQEVAVIRRIVNAWQAGRLTTRNARELQTAKRGTVQHFVANQYIQQPGRRGGKRASVSSRSKTIGVVSRLEEFYGGKPLPFAKFTPELCDKFLRSCLPDDGKPSMVDRVNTTYRFELVSISRDAVAAGLMKRRLHLDPVAPLKRRPKTSSNGHARPATRKPRARNGVGRTVAWPEALRYLLSLPENELDGTAPADLRDRFTSGNQDAALPPKAEFRTLVSRVRRGIVPKGFR